MLTALSIMVLLLAVAIPTYRTAIPNIKLQNTANEMMDSLQEARQKTVTEQSVYFIRFFDLEDKYQMIKQDGNEIIAETILDAEVDLEEITGFTDNQDAVFNFAGAISSAGEVKLINSKGKAALVSVRPSGFIRKE